jgi:hypothetical protein
VIDHRHLLAVGRVAQCLQEKREQGSAAPKNEILGQDK